MRRLRIFAGPNGSGKSTLYGELKGRFSHAQYVNPDNLLKHIQKGSSIDLSELGISCTESTWRRFYRKHGLYAKAPLLDESQLTDSFITFENTPKSYETSILSDFLRQQLLKTGATFFFETVFSHPSKLQFMQSAIKADYKCYLYFSAVNSPEICVDRVKQRVQQGGHDVPESKIRERYLRTLQNLIPALKLSYRAYLFDNSSSSMKLVAEMKPSKRIELPSTQIPPWLKTYVLDILSAEKE